MILIFFSFYILACELIPSAAYSDSFEESHEIIVIKSLIERLCNKRAAESLLLARTIVQASEQHDMDPFLVLAVIKVESSFRKDAISPVGAVGLMQIMPYTGREIASALNWGSHSKKDLFDPIKNIRMGVYYLKKLKRQFQDNKMLYLTAYNMGPGRLSRLQKISPHLPRYYGYAQKVMKSYHYFLSKKWDHEKEFLADASF